MGKGLSKVSNMIVNVSKLVTVNVRMFIDRHTDIQTDRTDFIPLTTDTGWDEGKTVTYMLFQKPLFLYNFRSYWVNPATQLTILLFQGKCSAIFHLCTNI